MFLSLDCEMGGLGLHTSLLTVGMVFADENFEPISSHHIELVPDDGIYHVEAGGMQVNQINLVDLAKNAMTYKEAGTEIYNLLKMMSNEGAEKLILIGKNVHGDMAQIYDKLITKRTWDQFVSYRVLDISAIHQLYRLKGIYPETITGSLESICEYYGISTNGVHNALRDAEMTLECLKRMMKEI